MRTSTRWAASRRAGRIAIVRETLGITAYATGDFALALRELRTYRRISGKDDQIALMVDSERGIGRSDRALETGRAVDRSALETPVRVALAIAMSGCSSGSGRSGACARRARDPRARPGSGFRMEPCTVRRSRCCARRPRTHRRSRVLGTPCRGRCRGTRDRRGRDEEIFIEDSMIEGEFLDDDVAEPVDETRRG